MRQSSSCHLRASSTMTWDEDDPRWDDVWTATTSDDE
jgi:hypothetical protein